MARNEEPDFVCACLKSRACCFKNYNEFCAAAVITVNCICGEATDKQSQVNSLLVSVDDTRWLQQHEGLYMWPEKKDHPAITCPSLSPVLSYNSRVDGKDFVAHLKP